MRPFQISGAGVDLSAAQRRRQGRLRAGHLFTRGTPLVRRSCGRIGNLVLATGTRWPAVALGKSTSRGYGRAIARSHILAKAATWALAGMHALAMFLRGVGRPAFASRTGRRGKRERQGSQTCCNPRDSLRQLLCDHCPTPFDSRGPVPSVLRLLSAISPGRIRPTFIHVRKPPVRLVRTNKAPPFLLSGKFNRRPGKRGPAPCRCGCRLRGWRRPDGTKRPGGRTIRCSAR